VRPAGCGECCRTVVRSGEGQRGLRYGTGGGEVLWCGAVGMGEEGRDRGAVGSAEECGDWHRTVVREGTGGEDRGMVPEVGRYRSAVRWG
jgi:hypothetical protein